MTSVRGWTRRKLCLTGVLAGVVAPLTGCQKPVLRVGFLGGITGPAADLGVAGRDACVLAVEHLNASGGVDGRLLELVAFDDRQQPAELDALVPSVVRAGLLAMVGPMTSSVAARWIPLANQHGIVTVSPTVTSSDFAGRDDHFFRVCSTTQEYARLSANHQVQTRGWRRFALLLDDANAAYSRSWARHFTEQVRALGAEVLHEEAYRRADRSESLAPAIDSVMSHRPDAVVLVTNAVDAAHIAQRLRTSGARVPLIAAEWAATDQFLELGGRAVEGVLMAQYMDRHSTEPNYLGFRDAFVRRFQRDPGFAEVAAYDAVRVVAAAWGQKSSDESLRQALQRVRRFDGLQQPIEFNEHGDARRRLFITEVRDGRYHVVTG